MALYLIAEQEQRRVNVSHARQVARFSCSVKSMGEIFLAYGKRVVLRTQILCHDTYKIIVSRRLKAAGLKVFPVVLVSD